MISIYKKPLAMYSKNSSPSGPATKMSQAIPPALAMLLFSTASHAEYQPNATMLGSPCTACHGTEGESQSAIPRLDTMSIKQIYHAMKSFK